MIVDSSAVVAILKDETDAHRHLAAIAADPNPTMSAATALETEMVLKAHGAQRDAFDEFCRRTGLRVVPFTPAQYALAREAHRRFGRGSGHPARLNFGDCFSYALAKDSGEPLLFKGDDFLHTDIEPALK